MLLCIMAKHYITVFKIFIHGVEESSADFVILTSPVEKERNWSNKTVWKQIVELVMILFVKMSLVCIIIISDFMDK